MPVVDPALHLVGVHDGMDRPDVVGVGVDRGESGVEGLAVVAGLLEPEGGHAADERGVRMVVAELAQRPDRTIAEALGVAEEEVELVPEHQRKGVGRPADEQVVEPTRGAVPVAAQPGADGAGVRLLAVVAVGGDERLVRVAAVARSAASVLIRWR